MAPAPGRSARSRTRARACGRRATAPGAARGAGRGRSSGTPGANMKATNMSQTVLSAKPVSAHCIDSPGVGATSRRIATTRDADQTHRGAGDRLGHQGPDDRHEQGEVVPGLGGQSRGDGQGDHDEPERYGKQHPPAPSGGRFEVDGGGHRGRTVAVLRITHHPRCSGGGHTPHGRTRVPCGSRWAAGISVTAWGPWSTGRPVSSMRRPAGRSRPRRVVEAIASRRERMVTSLTALTVASLEDREEPHHAHPQRDEADLQEQAPTGPIMLELRDQVRGRDVHESPRRDRDQHHRDRRPRHRAQQQGGDGALEWRHSPRRG